MNNTNNQLTTNKNKKKLKIIIFCIIIMYIIASKIYTYRTKKPVETEKSELAKMLEVRNEFSGHFAYYYEPNFYFPYKDKLYYYDYHSHKLYSMNMDCSEKKIISASNRELEYPSFYLVYKDEAYFYNIEGFIDSTKKKVNKKINLVTGEVKNLNNDYKFLPLYYNNGTIISLGNIESTEVSTFRKYNLDTETVYLENNYKYDAHFDYMYNYQNGDYYGIKWENKNDTTNYEIYKNKEFLTNLNVDIKNYISKIIYVDDNSIFFMIKDTLYKYDNKVKAIEKTENLGLNNIQTIESNNFETAFVYNRKDSILYELDKNNISFNKLFEIDNEIQKNKIYDTGLKLIIPLNANNFKYETKEDRLGKVIIYDKVSKKIKNIEKVRRAFFDYENNVLYIFIKNNGTYKIEKISLK